MAKLTFLYRGEFAKISNIVIIANFDYFKKKLKWIHVRNVSSPCRKIIGDS